MECSNGYQSVFKDKILVTQRPMCYNVVSINNNRPRSQVLAIGDAQKTFGTGPTSFFTNRFPQECPLTNCQLKDNNCNKVLDNQYITLNQA